MCLQESDQCREIVQNRLNSCRNWNCSPSVGELVLLNASSPGRDDFKLPVPASTAPGEVLEASREFVFTFFYVIFLCRETRAQVVVRSERFLQAHVQMSFRKGYFFFWGVTWAKGFILFVRWCLSGEIFDLLAKILCTNDWNSVKKPTNIWPVLGRCFENNFPRRICSYSWGCLLLRRKGVGSNFIVRFIWWFWESLKRMFVWVEVVKINIIKNIQKNNIEKITEKYSDWKCVFLC